MGIGGMGECWIFDVDVIVGRRRDVVDALGGSGMTGTSSKGGWISPVSTRAYPRSSASVGAFGGWYRSVGSALGVVRGSCDSSRDAKSAAKTLSMSGIVLSLLEGSSGIAVPELVDVSWEISVVGVVEEISVSVSASDHTPGRAPGGPLDLRSSRERVGIGEGGGEGECGRGPEPVV